MTIPYLSLISFNSGTVVSDGWKPYLVFDYVVTTHKFNPTMYKVSDVSHKEKLHTTIMKLHNEGWGYTKIHKYLRENGFEIGKSRSTVHTMIKRIKKRKKILSKSMLKTINNFRINFFYKRP